MQCTLGHLVLCTPRAQRALDPSSRKSYKIQQERKKALKMNNQTRQPSTAKRMRLGTRSCAECRRRRVRCVYPDQGGSCRQCIAHSTPCRKQGTSEPRTTQHSSDEPRANRRIQELENIVERLCRAVGASGDRDPTVASKPLISPAEALRYLLGIDQSLECADDPAAPLDEMQSFEDAPLLALLRQAVEFERLGPSHGGLYGRDRCHIETIQSLRALMPRNDDLLAILATTQPYWSVWPISPPSLVQTVPIKETLEIGSAQDFLRESLQSSNPMVVAKVILWFALCIQQLPSNFNCRPCPKEDLLEAFLNGAERLLTRDSNLQGSKEELECLMLQGKLYINMGRPRKAWLSVRRAITSGLLNGLQHTANTQSKVVKSLWAQAWMFDRQLSMGLGVPYGVPGSHPSLRAEPEDDRPETRIIRDLALIAGDLGDRNLNFRTVSYSETLAIDGKLRQCSKLMPAEWWLPTPSSQLSLSELYTRQVGRFYHSLLVKMTHFPYMLDLSHEGYDISRPIALSASRDMIDCYLTLRRSHQGALLVCDLMDFQAFSAALVLVIDLISAGGKRNRQQDQEDWNVVQRLTRVLDDLSRVMTCAVARQAAEVLNYLSLAGRGMYRQSEPYETVIPYFGMVRIARVIRGTATPDDETTGGYLESHPNDSCSTLNTIEIGTIPFSPPGPDVLGFPTGGDELRRDWMPVSEIDLTWDWHDVFYCPTG